jgi:hypothetical protein
MTKAKEITNDIRDNMNTQKIIFRVLIISSALLCALYMYLIGSITFNIIARKSLENTVATLTAKVNLLEISYLDNVNKADKSYAESKGFIDVSQNIFASRDVNHVAIR